MPVRSHTCCRLSIVHGIRLEGSLFGIRARAFARLSLLSRRSHLSISGFSRCSRCCQSDLVALSWVTAEHLWVCISAYSACLAPCSLRVPPHTHTHLPASTLVCPETRPVSGHMSSSLWGLPGSSRRWKSFFSVTARCLCTAVYVTPHLAALTLRSGSHLFSVSLEGRGSSRFFTFVSTTPIPVPATE